MSEITHVNWLRGGDLARLTIQKIDGQAHHCVVRALRNTEFDGRCDGCARRHSNANLRCAMTRHEPTFATEPVFYDFYTRRPILGEWELIDVETFNASLSREVWQRNTAQAATATGAKLVGLSD